MLSDEQNGENYLHALVIRNCSGNKKFLAIARNAYFFLFHFLYFRNAELHSYVMSELYYAFYDRLRFSLACNIATCYMLRVLVISLTTRIAVTMSVNATHTSLICSVLIKQNKKTTGYYRSRLHRYYLIVS